LTLQICNDSGKLALFKAVIGRRVNETAQGNSSGPLTWLLTGHKAGDNTQVTALADALGWSYTVKRFRYRSYELLTNRLLGITLAGIDRAASSELAPPWPELVITAGRRNEPVARWIRRQSGGKTRLVHVGRPWAPLDSFDLIVTTPQYFLPDHQNVFKITLPLHGVTSDLLDKAASAWGAKLAHLPRPYTAVLIGGDSGPFVYTREKGRRLGQLINSLAVSSGGSLLVTGSARTPTAVLEALRQELAVPNTVYRWSEDRVGNPYLGYLALADQLVVSGESMSMLAEAGFTGKPLYIYDPADSGSWWRYAHNYRYKPLTHRLAMLLAPRRMHRDVGNIQRQLVSSGRAVWLGQPFPQRGDLELPDDVERAADRVRALITQS